MTAQSKDPRIKSWKTLTNDNGFEFKYPDCWTVRTDNPDEGKDSVTEARDLAIEEGAECKRPLFDPPQQNSIGISGGWDKLRSKEEAMKEITSIESHSQNKILRKEMLIFKHLKVGSDEVIIYVERLPNVNYVQIRWIMKVYCSSVKVSIGGPAIKDPDQVYFDKFKAGDLAMPEPEKTIFESIKCVEPKKKRSSRAVKK